MPSGPGFHLLFFPRPRSNQLEARKSIAAYMMQLTTNFVAAVEKFACGLTANRWSMHAMVAKTKPLARDRNAFRRNTGI